MKTPMRLVKNEDAEGYLLTDIQKYLGTIEWRTFQDWIDGQTLGVTKGGKPFVYKWDFDDFVARRNRVPFD